MPDCDHCPPPPRSVAEPWRLESFGDFRRALEGTGDCRRPRVLELPLVTRLGGPGPGIRSDPADRQHAAAQRLPSRTSTRPSRPPDSGNSERRGARRARLVVSCCVVAVVVRAAAHS
eukprot:7387882-Alexandrium_andersonii.AAC.1